VRNTRPVMVVAQYRDYKGVVGLRFFLH